MDNKERKKAPGEGETLTQEVNIREDKGREKLPASKDAKKEAKKYSAKAGN